MEKQNRIEPAESALSPQVTPPNAVAIVDTNVFLDIYSCHDAITAYDAAYAEIGRAAVDHRKVAYRRARARESLLLALYLNKIGASTFTLQSEAMDKLELNAPPTAVGGMRWETDFTSFMIHFIKDYLLASWTPYFATPKAGWEKFVSDDLLSPELRTPGHAELTTPTGTNADTFHIACAKDNGIPLVTNEGFSETGYKPGKIVRRAAREGVRGVLPRDFYAGHIIEADEIDAFLRRFREEAPNYLDVHWQRHGKDASDEVLRLIYGQYRLFLRGEAEGRDTPVRVAV
ncbi:MAG TPA: hypothetical protein VGL81_07275 [Polyangiaceae bacterium]